MAGWAWQTRVVDKETVSDQKRNTSLQEPCLVTLPPLCTQTVGIHRQLYCNTLHPLPAYVTLCYLVHLSLFPRVLRACRCTCRHKPWVKRILFLQPRVIVGAVFEASKTFPYLVRFHGTLGPGPKIQPAARSLAYSR